MREAMIVSTGDEDGKKEINYKNIKGESSKIGIVS
jgi:hypothetical protein